MNSLTKLIADLREKSADMDNGMFAGSVSDHWFDGRRDGWRIAADMVETEFRQLLEKIREAESKIIEEVYHDRSTESSRFAVDLHGLQLD